MVSTNSLTADRVQTPVTMECPVCHSIFQLIHIEPSGMHELLDLVEAVKYLAVDLTLPTEEEIQRLKKEGNRKFYEATRVR